MRDPLIEHLAYREAITAWTSMIAATKQKIALQRKREGLSEKDTSNAIQMYEREIEIFQTAIEQAIAYLQKLGDPPG